MRHMSAMCPEQHKEMQCQCLIGMSAQRGFSIVSAIFLLIVMASLGAFMVTFSTVQHTTSMQDLEGSRAYQAARAGIEYGLYQVLVPAGGPNCAAATTLTWGGALSGFTNTVECSASAVFTEGTTTSTVYTLTSTAVNQGVVGSTTRVERQIQATVSR